MKKIIFSISIFFLFIINVSAADFDVKSKNIILYNMNDNKIIYERKPEEEVQIASITKLMTAIVTLENIEDLSKTVKITDEVYEGMEDYAIVGFDIGSEVTYEELLYGLLLPSGADAGNALAINVTGSKSKFIDLMNEKAKTLKLKHTHFSNAIGMDDEANYSSAKDVATMLKYALKNDKFKKIFTTKKYTIDRFNIKMKSTLLSYSSKYGVSAEYILGAKSGFTDGAGMCLASIAKIEDVNYLLVTLGADASNKANHIKDAITIYDYYSSNYNYQNVITKDQVLVNLPIKWGKEKNIDIKADKDVSVYVSNDMNLDKLKYKYNGIKEINKSIKKGTKIGTIKVTYDGEEVTTYNVLLNQKIKYKTNPFILGGIILIGLIIIRIIYIKIKRLKKRRKGKIKMMK